MAVEKGVEYSAIYVRADGERLAQLAKLIDNGQIRPAVDKVFQLADASEALAYVGSGQAAGKVILRT